MMKVFPWLSGFLCILVFMALFPIPAAQASPRAVPGMAGFQVNTNADNTEFDAYLTLREAMMAANGNFKAAYSPAEQLLMSGCTFSPAGVVTGGCGVGGDYITFTAVVTTILPLTALPEIVKDGVQIYGTAGKTMIDMKSCADSDGFLISANGVYLYNLIIINNGGGNFQPLIMLKPGFKGLRVVGNYVGVTPTTTSCSDPLFNARPSWGVYINVGTGTAAAGDATAYIYENVIGCSENDGVTMDDASYVVVGQDTTGKVRPNYVGITPKGDNIGNFRWGIGLYHDWNHGNVVTGNEVAYNADNGIQLIYAIGAVISKNNTHHNGGSGIEVTDSSSNTLANNQAHHNGASGILLYYLTPSYTFNNTISGGTYYHNTAAGIAQKDGGTNNRWWQVSTYENGGLGIDLGNNGSVDAPPISVSGITPQPQGVLVNGTFTGTAGVMYNYTIELYRSTRDASGYGEGKAYIGSVTYQKIGSGPFNWSIPDPLGAVCYTATITRADPTNPALTTPSEFSATLGTMCNLGFMPLVRR